MAGRKGVVKNYFPDFFLPEGNKLIEIKPKNLHKSISVQLKKKAAEKYCLEKDWAYEIIAPEKLTEKKIILLHKQEKIKFIYRYEQKFMEKYNV